jgi:hypothetical protein
VVDSRVLGDVDCERRFAHRGTSGNDDQLALLEAAGKAVKVSEISR